MELVQSEEERVKSLRMNPGTLGEILRHVANGGSLIERCQLWRVPYSEILAWMNETPARSEAYRNALISQMSYQIERVLDELKSVAFIDMLDAFDNNHRLKPLHEIPENIRRCIAGIEVEEIWEGVGKDRELIGHCKKIKTYDKVKGLELIGKKFAMFIDRARVDVESKTLEDLIADSMGPEVIDVTPTNQTPTQTEQNTP